MSALWTPRYQPAQTFSMAEHGFFGAFYPASETPFPEKCLIVLGGSSGSFSLTQRVAEHVVDAGFSALAIAYHGALGLPKFPLEQPVDVVEAAATYAKERLGYQQIGLWGISMGGGLALLAGSLLPELVSCVVAVAPTALVMQGEIRKKPVAGSSFSFHGTALPYASYVPADGDAWYHAYRQASRLHQEPYSRDLLLAAYEANTNPAAIIPVWNLAGPLLLLGGAQDGICPMPETCSVLLERLNAHSFPHPVTQHLYPHLGHYILPFQPAGATFLRAERTFPLECQRERTQSWQDTLHFLREIWNTPR